MDPVLKRALTDPEMRAALKKVAPTERVALTLAAQGYKPAEIARMLGVAAKTIRQELYTGRKRIRAYLRETGGTATAFLALVPQRLRQRLGRRLDAIADAWSAASTSTATLAPLLAVALMTTGTGPAPAAVSRLPRPLPEALAAPGDALTASTGSGLAPTLDAAQVLQQPGTTDAVGAGARGAVSPATTRLIAVTPAPQYDQNHTVVALGDSSVCGCLVLFQSTDGAAHWTWAPGPPTGAQVALPPSYPADPRIFIGNRAGASATDYVVDHFGGTATPLLTLSGFLAPAADFDGGDPLLYVATTTGVTAINMATGQRFVAVVASGRWGTASLASAPTAAGILALVPPGSVQAAASDRLGQPVSVGATLLGCQAETCSRLADAGESPQVLAVSATYAADQLLAAWSPSAAQLSISRDGGHSFFRVMVPSGTGTVKSVAAGGGRLWMVAVDQAGQVMLAWTTPSGDTWHVLPLIESPSTAAVSLVAVGADRLLLVVDGQGYRCTVDAGQTWAASCPAA